jgi:hypothetical protein
VFIFEDFEPVLFNLPVHSSFPAFANSKLHAINDKLLCDLFSWASANFTFIVVETVTLTPPYDFFDHEYSNSHQLCRTTAERFNCNYAEEKESPSPIYNTATA